MSIIFYIIFAIIFIVIAWLIAVYNGFVKLKNRAKEAWSDISVQLKRRYDLIPNLVSTVKGYATHEREAFENVTNARARAISAQGVGEKAQAENMLSGALKSLFAVAEAYPELKASVNFLELQRELSDTEDKIQASRRFYNANVRDLNTKIESVPANIVAGMFNFKQMELFELENLVEKEAPQVKF